MAFISEIRYGPSARLPAGVGAHVEISVAPEELYRLADFRVAAYRRDGRLADEAGLGSLNGQMDPETGWMIFTYRSRSVDPDPAAPGAEAIALTDARSGVLAFHGSGYGAAGITAQDGPAAGATSRGLPAAAGASIRFDASGTGIDGALSPDDSLVCLTQGTLLDCERGQRPVEDLAPGDLVVTRDHGLQPVRLILRRTFSGDAYRTNRRLWPVCIQTGALGFGLPQRNLRVSQQHRMLYQHIRVPLLFGEDAVFVRAKSLAASMSEVYVDNDADAVTYFHLVLDRHEVIYAEGAPTESFHPGPRGLSALEPEARAEVLTLFPDCRVDESRFADAYMTIRSWELTAAVA